MLQNALSTPVSSKYGVLAVHTTKSCEEEKKNFVERCSRLVLVFYFSMRVFIFGGSPLWDGVVQIVVVDIKFCCTETIENQVKTLRNESKLIGAISSSNKKPSHPTKDMPKLGYFLAFGRFSYFLQKNTSRTGEEGNIRCYRRSVVQVPTQQQYQ